MFEWLGDIIGGIGDAIGGTFEGISDALANSIFEAMLAWLYETIYGAPCAAGAVSVEITCR